jgi:division protein CdvB (Snf7/Vps24/ESCRT-III family)
MTLKDILLKIKNILRIRKEEVWTNEVENKLMDVDKLYKPEEFILKIEEIIGKLDIQIQKLKRKYSNLEQKNKEYFEKCIEALANKDEERAKIYAQEVAEIRKLARMIFHSELIFEQIKLRLETIEELREVVGLLTPLNKIILSIKEEVKGIIPEAALTLTELQESIEGFISATTGMPIEEISISTDLSGEARDILEEASIVASERIEKSFPEITEVKDEQIKTMVYAYIKEHYKDFDIEECASVLSLSEEEVEKAIEMLEKEGKIILKKEEEEHY